MSLEGKMKELCRLVYEIHKEYGIYVTASAVREQKNDINDSSSCTFSEDGENYPIVWFYPNKGDNYEVWASEAIAEIEKGRGDGQ